MITTASSAPPKSTASSPLLPAFMGLALMFAVFSVYLIVSSFSEPGARPFGAPGTPPERVMDRLKGMALAERNALQNREQEALPQNPMDLSALKNLAVLAEVAGDKAQSEALTLLAGKRSLRDLPVQAAVLKINLDRQDYAGALYGLDGLIRARPERMAELLAMAASFAETDRSMAPLVDVLAQNPPWRSALLAWVGGKSKQADTGYRLLSALKKSGSPVTNAELRPYLSRLITERAYDKANFVWLDFLSDVELRKAAFVFDGEFALDLGNRYFDWTYDSLKNVDLRIVPRGSGSTDRVLRVEFASGRTAFSHLYQILRLSPGSYVLSGEAKAENLENEGGLVWRVYCISQETALIAESSRNMGTVAWGAFDKSFVVPPVNCETQQLRLELNARAVLDQQISGRAFYDNIAIVPRMGAAANP
jgi:hypothetical protein